MGEILGCDVGLVGLLDGRELGLVGVALGGLIVGLQVGTFNGDTVGVNEGDRIG